MEIYIVRHGQTDWNKDNIAQGTTDIPLNEEGIKQAYIVKEKLKDVLFTKCYSSPLSRALTTAKIITNLPIIKDDRIIERSFGKLEGNRINYDQLVTHWDYKLNASPFGEEKIKDVIARAHEFNEMIKNLSDEEVVLIVSHGAFMKALHFDLVGFDENTNFLDFRINNCEVCKYSIKNNKVIEFIKL